MDNTKPNLHEPEPDPQSEIEPKSQPEPQLEPESEPQPTAGQELYTYLNEGIKRVFERAKLLFKDTKDYYRASPRLQKVTYQGKYLPAFWTIACIFSLMVNIILIAVLISFGRHFFELKTLLSDSLLTETSNNLSMMDKAHIVTTVRVETTVRMTDNLPVVFDIPINQDIELSLVKDTRVSNASIYLNNTVVPTDLTLPAKTLLQTNLNLTIPVSTTVPVDMTAPVSLQVPVDIAIDQTDLHQSILGLQGVIEPIKTAMSSSFNSPEDFFICNHWWTGWMCSLFFGK